MISFCNLNNPYWGPLHRKRPIFLYCLFQRKYRWKSWLSPQLGNLERPDCSKLHHNWWAQVGSNLVNSHVSPGNLSNFTSWWCTKSLIRLRGWLAVENLVDIWSTSSSEKKTRPRWRHHLVTITSFLSLPKQDLHRYGGRSFFTLRPQWLLTLGEFSFSSLGFLLWPSGTVRYWWRNIFLC